MELWLVVTDGNQSRGSCCPLADTSVLYALTLFLVWVESFSLPLSKEGWAGYGFQRAELCGTWATPQLALTPPDCARDSFPLGPLFWAGCFGGDGGDAPPTSAGLSSSPGVGCSSPRSV